MTASTPSMDDLTKLLAGGVARAKPSKKRIIFAALAIFLVTVVIYTLGAFAIAGLAGYSISLRMALAGGWLLSIIAGGRQSS